MYVLYFRTIININNCDSEYTVIVDNKPVTDWFSDLNDIGNFQYHVYPNLGKTRMEKKIYNHR